MTMKRLLAVFFATWSLVNSQMTTVSPEKLNDIISLIFTKQPGLSTNTGPNPVTPEIPNRNPDGSGGDGAITPIPGIAGCDCVPYYLCQNGTINMFGETIIDIRIQDGPCGSDYLQQCCPVDQKTDKPVTQTPSTVDPNEPTGCGIRHPNGVGFRIMGHTDEAEFGEFPWMTAVLREEGIESDPRKLLVYQCGGSLIHPKVVLTAAHCVASKDKTYMVRAGEWDTATTDELLPYQDRNVVQVISHPNYYSGALFNDIALLILETPFDIADNVDTICLPPQGEIIQDTRCFASGWGRDKFGKEGKYQVILKKLELPIVERNECQGLLRTTRLGKHFILHESFVCAGGEPGKDTCKGDGGGPLVCPIPGQRKKYYQTGIVAWGIGCGENGIPGVYANVAKFTDWIDEHLRILELDTNTYKNPSI